MTSIREVMERPIAHRGLHDSGNGIIENSPSAFKAAIEAGYAIECDLQLTADEIPIVIHDGTLDRVTEQSGRVRDISAGQATKIKLAGSKKPDRILSFADLLKLVDSRVAIAIELKPQVDGLNRKLAETAVEALKNYHGPIAFISFAPELLVHVKECGFKGPTGIIIERFVSEEAQDHLNWFQRFSMRHLLHYPRTRFDFVDCDQNALDMPAVRLFHALGFPLAAWTIRSQEQADQALKHSDQYAFEGFIPASD